jgi:hypothetical protein
MLASSRAAALEAGAVGNELAAFFTADVVQQEFPNRLVPGGARRDLTALLDGAARGKKVMRAQRYELLAAPARSAGVRLLFLL